MQTRYAVLRSKFRRKKETDMKTSIKSVSTRNSILAAISLATFWAQACGDPPASNDDSYEDVSLGSAEQALAVDAVGTRAMPKAALQSGDLTDAPGTVDFERLVGEFVDLASRTRRDVVSAGSDTQSSTVFAEMDKGAFKDGCEKGGHSFVDRPDGSFQCNLGGGMAIKCENTTSRCTLIKEG
jgi:hypothetical protein